MAAPAPNAPYVREFHFDFLGILSPLFFVLRLNAHCSHIRLTRTTLDVAMGWGFTAVIPLARVRAVSPDASLVTGIGVHGFGDSWLVNGSHRNIVRIELAGGGAPARVCGVPLTLRTLRLGVAERDDFVAAVRAGMAED